MSKTDTSSKNKQYNTIEIFKNNRNRLTDERANPLSKRIETHTLIELDKTSKEDTTSTKEDTTAIRSDTFLENRNLYYPLYFKYPDVTSIATRVKNQVNPNNLLKYREPTFPGRDTTNKLNLKTTLYNTGSREFRVCSDRDKLQNFFDKPSVISFGSTVPIKEENVIYIRFLSKAIPIYAENQEKEETDNIKFTVETDFKLSDSIKKSSEKDKNLMLYLTKILNSEVLTDEVKSYHLGDRKVTSKNITANYTGNKTDKKGSISIKIILTYDKEKKITYTINLKLPVKFENLFDLEQVAYLEPNDKYSSSFIYFQVGKLVSLNYVFYNQDITNRSTFFEIQGERPLISNYEENKKLCLYTIT